MSKRIVRALFAVAACLGALTGCQMPRSQGQPVVKQMDVNGARLSYVEQGRGAAVVLVHGAVSDLRTWERQLAALAQHYHAIAFTQRYYGTTPWRDDWPKYRIHTHANDLAEFIRILGAGPVHLVAWSSGGHIALNVALHHPRLVHSVFVYEPVVSSYVDDPVLLKAIGDDAAAMVGPVFPAMKSGDMSSAARFFVDGVAGASATSMRCRRVRRRSCSTTLACCH
jgi:pimeloyl-ACP methyl ester carboxylesterase